MKKAILFVAFGAFALASCKKDYTCSCTVNGQKYPFQYKDVKKKDAEEACETQQSVYSTADPSAKCSLN